MASNEISESSSRKNSNIQNDSHFMSHLHGHGSSPIAEVEVKPRQRVPLMLGDFTTDHPPIGFSFEPNSNPGSLTAQIVVLKTDKGNKFVSYLTNSGKKKVSTKVWQL